MNLTDFQQCNICLENGNSTVSIYDLDEADIKWVTKLQFTIPELEWLEEYLICESCIKQLEKSWKFKKLILNLETERRLVLSRRELCHERNHDFRDSCDTTDYFFTDEQEITCDVCFKTFTTQTQLRQHTLQNHSEEQVQKNNNDKGTILTKTEDLFTCYDCGIGFSTKNNLLYHIADDHGIEKHNKHVCLNCSKNFESEYKLNDHTQLCTAQLQLCICNERCSKEDQKSHSTLCKNQSKDISMHQCGTCKNFYVSEKNLQLHTVWCSNKEESQPSTYVKTTIGNFNCDICILKFNSLEEYKAHNLLKHNVQNDLTDSQPTKKRRGRKSHRMFSCEICCKEFEYVKLVIEHCVSEHGMEKKRVKPYTCEKCNMRFASSANLDQHRHYHDKNRKHVCSLCGKGFMTKSDLTVHEYTHYNRRNYKCSKCDKAFNTNKNLRTHILVVHTDRSLWKYGCSICEKRFPFKANYEQHLRRHTGEKKYTCHICIKSFVSKTEMKRHINLHSNIKAFKCHICNKEYKERRTYEAHLTKIHGIGNAKITVREKKFVCHICPAQFYDKPKLSKHLCSHAGLKPFACNACDKKFTDKSYLKHHLKIAHNIVELPRIDLMD